MKTNLYRTLFCAVAILLLYAPLKSSAQIANYAFSQSNSFYVPITGGISLGSTTSNDEYFVDAASPLGGTTVLGNGLPIGFTFNYNGSSYDKFGVNVNGWIVLGNGFVNFTGANLTVPISGTLNNVIAAFARDLNAQAGSSIRFETIGQAPSRILVVQWDKYKRSNAVSVDSLGFQIRLNEADGSVNIKYGKMLSGSTLANTVQVGIKGTGALDVTLRSTATDWNATTASTVATTTCNFNGTIIPATGLTFTWVIPVPCTTPPTAGIVSIGNAPNCVAAKILSLNGSSTGSGISLQWLFSADSLSWTAISGANATSFQVIQTSSTYYQCVITCSGITDSSNVVLVTGASSANTCYCTTNLHGAAACQAGSINDLTINGTSFSNLASGCLGLNGNSYTSYLDTGTYTTTLFAGLSYNFNVTSTGDGTISVWIDYNQNGVFEASEWTQIAAAANANILNTGSVIIPANAISGKTGMRVRYRLTGGANSATDACTQFGSGETEDYLVTIGQQSPCSAPPSAGIASSSASGVCAGVAYTVQLTGNTLGSGLTFQWQASFDSINWSDIVGATNSFYATTGLQNTYYRCYLVCNGSSDTSNVISVLINPATLCYCTTTLHNNANCNPAGSINDVFISGTALSNLGTGCASITAQSYSSYSPSGSNTASLDIGAAYNFNVTVTNANNTISLWIDYDQSGTFDPAEWTQVAAAAQAGIPSTAVITIPVTAVSGQTGMRIRTRQQGGANANTDACTSFASGETEDYFITLVQQTPCVAPPTAGLTVATDSSVCAGISLTLSLSGNTTGSGMGYGWQSSTDSINWINVGGVVYPFYSTSLTVSTYFRCVLQCSGMADTSSVVYITLNAATNCYCASAASQGSDTDIGNVTLGTLNNGLGTPATQNPTSIRTYTDFTGLPPESFTQNTTYPISITQINSANFFTARVAVFIDYLQNGNFTDAGENVFIGTTTNVAGGNTISGTITIPANAIPGNTRMRVIVSEGNNAPGACTAYQWGETEDYTVTIVQQLPCVAPPTAGFATASDSSVCAVPLTLSLIGATSGSGMSYEWQSSTDSLVWTAITGATNPFYTSTQTQSSYYRCILTCSAMSDTSTVVYVIQNVTSACYCASGANSGTDADIGNITFGSLNNGSATPVLSNVLATGTYTDYTAQAPKTYNRSTAYTISVSQITSAANFFAARITVFIDYNQNGNFTDANERVFTGATSGGAVGVSTITGSVTIPATASLGNTRMRIVLSENAGPGNQNSCGTFQFGETEDYTINIDVFNGIKSISTPVASLSIFPNPVSSKATINYTITEKSDVSLELYNIVGERVATLLKESQTAGEYTKALNFKQNGITAGVYFLKLTNGNQSKTVRVVVF